MNNKQFLKNVSAILILSGVFNYFFLYNKWGISVLIFNTLLLSVYYYFLKKRATFKPRTFFISAAIILLLSVGFLRFNFLLFRMFNVIIIVLLYGFIIFNTFQCDLSHLVKLPFIGVFKPIGYLPVFFKDFYCLSPNKGKNTGKILIGLVLGISMLFIILPLLLSSDAVFAHNFNSILLNINTEFIIKFILRILVFLFVASYLYSQLNITKPTPKKEDKRQESIKFDTVISFVFLSILNIVYLFYAYIQIKYLFMGIALPEHLTYAEYARQGFFQLVIVTIINVCIIIIFNKLKQHTAKINLLLVLTVICTYIMTFSSFYRMYLYESTYGFTRLRLLVYLCLIGEVVLLIPIVIGIFKKKFPFLEYVIIFSLCYYTCINFINIDNFIANRNVDRYITTRKIDLDLFNNFSSDATPALERLMYELYLDKENPISMKQLNYVKEILAINYDKTFNTRNGDLDKKHWFELTLSDISLINTYKIHYPDGHNSDTVYSNHKKASSIIYSRN